MGIVSAEHELGQDNQAIADVQKMPPASYQQALSDPGFLSMLGSMYQQANQFEVAQGLLERSGQVQIAAGGHPSIPLQLQLAAIYLQRNNTAQAYAIYRQILSTNPERADAWKGLIATLQSTNRDAEALKQIALVRARLRKELEADFEFVAIRGEPLCSQQRLSAGRGINEPREFALCDAQDAASRDHRDSKCVVAVQHQERSRTLPGVDGSGPRQDLTVTQRETVQEIWAKLERAPGRRRRWTTAMRSAPWRYWTPHRRPFLTI